MDQQSFASDGRRDPLPLASTARRALLDQIAAQVPAPVGRACVLVGVDGPDGAGKSVFADELARTLRSRGRPVVRISVDDFHNTRDIRHRRGRESPVGYWLDSYNYARFVSDVLGPLGPGGDNQYRRRAHDLVTDAVLEPPGEHAADGSVVIVDGIFLHRDGIVGRWDFSIFLEVPFEVTVTRMASRDGLSTEADDRRLRRYVDGQRIYFSACAPWTRATVVIDNSDVAAPTVRTDAPRRPHPTPSDLTIDSYTQAADRYVAHSAPPSPEVRGHLDEIAELVPGGHLLELGSGPGWDADYLELLGIRVSRTDAAPSFVAGLRAAGHEARLLDARSEDYGRGYDGVLANAVLLHLDRRQAEEAFQRARRAVVPRGIFGITLKEGDGAEWTTTKLGRPRYFTYWRAAELVNALERAGWQVHSLRHVRGRHEPWLMVIARTPAAS